MKIAILSPFYPYRGGIAQYNALLYTEIAKRNSVKAFSFTTLYPRLLFPGKTQFVQETDNVMVIENDRCLNSINPISYLTTAKKINNYNPDILIIPYWLSLLAPAYGIVIRFLNKNIRVIPIVHNAIPHEKRFFDIPFAKFFFKRCDAFIVMSEPVKMDLLKMIPSADVFYYPHPIYDQYKKIDDKVGARLQLGLKEDKKTLLFFGLIREYKGLNLLISAMDNLDDSYQLIIAGENYEDFSKYQDLIDKSSNKDNIKVLNEYIPDEKVGLLFSAADLLVLPYRSGTQSGVISVAYQLELPMLATNVGALGSTIEKAKTGLVVDEISSKSIGDGIKTFFQQNNTDLYIENIKKQKEHLSWNSFCSSLENFFKQSFGL